MRTPERAALAAENRRRAFLSRLDKATTPRALFCLAYQRALAELKWVHADLADGGYQDGADYLFALTDRIGEQDQERRRS